MPLESQLGAKAEAAYGTAVVVDRFFEFLSEDISPETDRLTSDGLRAGRRTASSTQFQPIVRGFSGTLELEVLTKGFAFWLKQMLGAVATTNNADGSYTHTGSLANLCGSSFTAQVNRPLGACATENQAFTFAGGKVAKWTLELGTDGNLKLSMDVLFRDGTTETALAVASYPAGTEVISWTRATANVGGTALPIKSWSIECDHKLKDDRHFLTGSTRRAEPVAEDKVEISVSFTTEFDNLTLYNKVIAETAANALTTVVLVAEGPTPIIGAVYPGLTISMPAVRLDEGGPAVDGAGIIEAEWSGMALDAGAGPITIAYRSTDTTA